VEGFMVRGAAYFAAGLLGAALDVPSAVLELTPIAAAVLVANGESGNIRGTFSEHSVNIQ
jgi:hypothetical protein